MIKIINEMFIIIIFFPRKKDSNISKIKIIYFINHIQIFENLFKKLIKNLKNIWLIVFSIKTKPTKININKKKNIIELNYLF